MSPPPTSQPVSQRDKNSWLSRALVAFPYNLSLVECFEWYLLARAIVCVATWVVLAFFQVVGELPTQSVVLAYALLALAFSWNLLAVGLRRMLASRYLFVAISVSVDLLLISFWLSRAVPVSSFGVLLYLAEIFIVSLIYTHRTAVGAAVLSALALGGSALLGATEIVDSPLVWGLYTSLFVVLGYLGGFLSDELRHAYETLGERQKTIEHLQSFQERIVGYLPTGLMSVDAKNIIRLINPAGAEILGKLPTALEGKPLEKVTPELLPFFTRVTEKPLEEHGLETGDEGEVTETGDPTHPSYFVRSRSERGTARLQQTVELNDQQSGVVSRILRGDVAQIDSHSVFGEAPIRVLIFQDVTKLSHLEARLKQHEKLAAVGQLAAGIAHEIRNPLASMSGSIQVLKSSLDEKSLGDEESRLLNIAVREIDRLNGLITEFLDFVKPEHIEFASVDLKPLLEDILTTAKSQNVFREGLQLKGELNAAVLARANESKIRQVAWNLLLNAIQATEGSQGIEVGCEKVSGGRVRFWVRDEGNGMSEEVKQRLFEPFFTTKPEGTGLGLATAYKIIEAHAGEILVHSEQEKGTKFEVYLDAA